jgi:hypothetical protein
MTGPWTRRRRSCECGNDARTTVDAAASRGPAVAPVRRGRMNSEVARVVTDLESSARRRKIGSDSQWPGDADDVPGPATETRFRCTLSLLLRTGGS